MVNRRRMGRESDDPRQELPTKLPFKCGPRPFVYLVFLPGFVYVSLGTLVLDAGGAAGALAGPMLFALFMFATVRLEITANRVTVINTLREVHIPLHHVLGVVGEISQPGVDEIPGVVLTSYGKFAAARLLRGRDPGSRSHDEVLAALDFALAQRSAMGHQPQARWRGRRVRGSEWVMLGAAAVSLVGQVLKIL
jgi:hypothetical protein